VIKRSGNFMLSTTDTARAITPLAQSLQAMEQAPIGTIWLSQDSRFPLAFVTERRVRTA
jgi:hypothetical protein